MEWVLTEREVKDKLNVYAQQFRTAYLMKEWAKAKFLYFKAQLVATFLEFPESELAELFGNRPYKEDWEDLKTGLFPEDEVERASWECIRIHETYDEMHLRPRSKYGKAFVKDWRDMGGGIVQVRLEEVRT